MSGGEREIRSLTIQCIKVIDQIYELAVANFNNKKSVPLWGRSKREKMAVSR